MKDKRKYIVLILILLFLQMAVLIYSWNLKSGITNSFTGILVALGLSFFGIVLLTLWLFDLKVLVFKKKEASRLPEKTEKKPDDIQRVHREYFDPKSVAESVFKNVLLKRSTSSFGEKLLQNMAAEFDGVQGVFYLYDKKENLFKPTSYYALIKGNDIKNFSPGEGVCGQAVMDEKITTLSNLPENYRRINSGLGERDPSFIYFTPLFFEKNCIALIELSTFKEIPENRISVLNYLINLGAKKLVQLREKING